MLRCNLRWIRTGNARPGFHRHHRDLSLRRNWLWFSFAKPLRRTDRPAEALGRRRHLQRVLVRIHPFREEDAVRIHPGLVQLRGKFLRRSLASLITVVGNEYTLDTTLFEERQMIGGKALDTIAGCHIAIARAPEGQRIDEGFTQDHFRGCTERSSVPDAPMWPW